MFFMYSGNIRNMIEINKYVFVSLLIVILIVLFEMISFYVAVHFADNAIKKGIDKMTVGLAEMIEEKTKNVREKYHVMDVAIPRLNRALFNEYSGGVLRAFADQEKRLTDKINNYNRISSLILIIILVVVICILYKSEWNKCAVYVGITTTGILGLYYFFLFKYIKKYVPPGQNGKDEVLEMIYKNIDVV